MSSKLFNETGLVPGQDFKVGQWKDISSHTDTEIRGFFGDFRFLSNFWPARVYLDGVEYTCSENAYHAAKFTPDERMFFQTCKPHDALKYAKRNFREDSVWTEKKLEVMRDLLVQKFDRQLNPELYHLLVSTGTKYMEETNWWGDKFWGVHRTSLSEQGVGENNLGKLLMDIRG
jgi:ribA/ribD-fused uncharacterized protein